MCRKYKHVDDAIVHNYRETGKGTYGSGASMARDERQASADAVAVGYIRVDK